MLLLRAAFRAMSGFAGGELDLRQIPPGLVTLTGPNYSGKTTLLELPLAAFYREWASRTTNDISKWADARDSWVECDLDVGGTIYRARVNIDGISRKAHAILSRQRPNGRWQLLTDGKVSTFDEAMAQLVPPKDALLCSQFAAQNRAGSFTGAGRAKRKDLFIQFLWLDHIIAMAETAKTCHAMAETTAILLRARREALERESTPEREAEITAHLVTTAQRIEQLDRESQDLNEQILADDLERLSLTEAVARYVRATAESARLTTVIAEATKTLADVPGLRARLEEQFALDETQSQDRLARGSALLMQRETALHQLCAEGDHITAAAEMATTLQTTIDQIRHRQAAIPAEEVALTTEQRDIAAARTIAKVPCGGTGIYQQCQFLQDAQAAQKRVGDRTARDVRRALQALTDERSSLRDALDAARRDLQPLLGHADRAADLRVAGERLAECAQRRAELVVQEEERMANARVRRDEALDALAERERIAIGSRETAERALRTADAVIAETEGAQARVTTLEEQLKGARAQFTEVERQRTSALLLHAEWTRTLVDLQTNRTKAAQISTTLAEVEAAARVQSLLMRACHRDGLPTLEIAAAAPAISQLTTDLLEHSGFGTRFRVDVTTLVPTADGKDWKEDFAIRVWDNDRGKEILDVGDLSGGERILVEEALRAALTIYMASRHPHTHRVQTTWRDETTAPLDSENRTKYVAMLRRLMVLGGYKHCVFISHASEVVEAADTIFDVEDGQATRRTA
jgi:DNA repair exonuclease SbcCD ATPase subunit